MQHPTDEQIKNLLERWYEEDCAHDTDEEIRLLFDAAEDRNRLEKEVERLREVAHYLTNKLVTYNDNALTSDPPEWECLCCCRCWCTKQHEPEAHDDWCPVRRAIEALGQEGGAES